MLWAEFDKCPIEFCLFILAGLGYSFFSFLSILSIFSFFSFLGLFDIFKEVYEGLFFSVPALGD